MKEVEVLAPLANLDKLIADETIRLQKQLDNENLPDPSDNARENIAEAEGKTYEAPAKSGEKTQDLPPKEETSPRVPSKAKK